MDPQTTDPKVLFVHPPFNTFPNSILHPEGLTYSLMAENPEWFLDANDFISQPNLNPHAVPYPPHLEPPRGWCPAKKKDLKDRGGEGWPEGEEPRLRCTFCRRTYAGVNAKSMWRRHVFEKHKIAMSNRRDGNTDRPRGRGSGKENKQASTKFRDEIHDSLVSMVVAPQTAPENVSHKSRFRSEKPTASRRRRVRDRKKDTEDEAEASSYALWPSQKASSESSEYESEPDKPSRTRTLPLTPHADTFSDPPYRSSANSDGFVGTSPVISHPVIPESPYNPLQTPSFRHSPPRLPSDQPWRFPSPSHPLHSTNRDLSLTMLTRPAPSPIPRAATSLTASPLTLLTLQSSPHSDFTSSNKIDFETPARSKLHFSKPTNRVHLFRSNISSPIGALKPHPGIKRRPENSPLRNPLTTPRRHKKRPSELSEAWFSEDHLATASTPSCAILSDPFSIYDSWPPIGDGSQLSPVHIPKGPLEPESPVLRSGSFPSVVGVGLLEPLGILSTTSIDPDLQDMLFSPELGEETLIDGKRPAASPTVAEISPPAKRRRLSSANIRA